MIEVVLIASAALVVIAAVCIVERRRRVDFKKRHSPMSDQEFMAQCTPGTDPKVALKVRRIIAKSVGVDYERIHPSTRFTDDFGRD